jgi:methylmalonyl-CoA/ethylmalonyl-CoA epimerase
MSEEPTPEVNPEAKEMFARFMQIGVVVKDADKSIRALSEVFGLGPFATITFPVSDQPDPRKTYRGKPGTFKAKIGFVRLAPTIELEIIEPLEGESVWADFLREHGEGIHHIRFNHQQADKIVDYLTAKGVGVEQMQSGVRPGSWSAYFDTQELVGFPIEILNEVPGTDGLVPVSDGKVQM